MKIKGLTKSISFLLIAVFAISLICIEPTKAEAASKKSSTVTVSTKKALVKEIKKKAASTILFETDAAAKLTIKKYTNAKNKKLIVDAGNMDIVNKSKFKSVTIKNVKSWSERVSGNKIALESETALFSVYKNMTVSKLTAPDYRNIKVGKKASIKTVKYTKIKPEPTAVVTPEVTPEPTAVVTSIPTITVTPEVTPEPTAIVTPEITVSPTPVVTPIVTPDPTPIVTTAPTSAPAHTDNAMIVSRLLKALQMGASKHSEKGYITSFREKYSLVYKNDTELETDNYFMSYEGEGFVTLSYTVRNGESIESEVIGKELLSKANGYLCGTQRDKFKFNVDYIDKTDSEKSRTLEEDYEDSRTFVIEVDDDYFYVVSKNTYTDKFYPEDNRDDSFYGKIKKNLFIDSVSDKTVTKISSQLLYMDIWPYIEQLIKYSDVVFTELDITDINAVSFFIKKNQISCQDKGETMIISFSFDSGDIFYIDSSKKLENAPRIQGLMEIDKRTGEMVSYSYDLKDFMIDAVKIGQTGKQKYNVEVDEFVAEGVRLNVPLGDLPFEYEYEEYDENTQGEFIEKFMTNVMK